MKTALYIEDGVTQIILTPESDWERVILADVDKRPVTFFRGEFYSCRGGWDRHGSGTESLIIRMAESKEEL